VGLLGQDKASKPFSYGGQAVIEGVMMRGRHSYAVSVRKQDGIITTKEELISPLAVRYPILGKPFIRGIVSLVESLVLGIKALTHSAQEFAEEEEEELTIKDYIITFGLAIVFTIAFFVALPAWVIQFFQKYISSHVAINFLEGLIKLTFFLTYIRCISFMKDIKRVFEYHGAEHKSINCLEAGEELTVEAVKRHRRFHNRCGTSFIVIVLLTSILVFSFFGKPPFLLRILYHLALMPVVAGLSYELIRLAGNKKAPGIFRIIVKPGIWTQYLTTREPDEQQIEVAIESLKKVLETDKEKAKQIVDIRTRQATL
jgi:uncharacterized protein YqhQ